MIVTMPDEADPVDAVGLRRASVEGGRAAMEELEEGTIRRTDACSLEALLLDEPELLGFVLGEVDNRPFRGKFPTLETLSDGGVMIGKDGVRPVSPWRARGTTV